jgi:EAL domain-containing protein (putative c-di-GMP-specific phosphodiesterase class I)
VRAGLTERPRQAAVIDAVVGLADAFGVSFVAGAVKTEDQLDRLREIGCRLVQGKAVAAPMAADEVPGYLRRLRAAASST